MNGVHREAEIPKGPRYGIRHAQILLVFLNITCVYMSSLNISAAILAMTNAETTNADFPKFDWSEKERNYIIFSFYWANIVTQFPAGYLNRRFGAKIVLLASTFSSAILTLLTPYLVTIGSWQAYCAIRVVQGLLQGALFPAINDHIAKWSPPQERYVLGALAYSGIDCGTVFSALFSVLIASSPLGWPGISYISGGICMAWCFVWLMFGARNAPSSPYISKEECHYIESSLKRGKDFHQKTISVPYWAMLTSTPFLALTVARCGEMWGFTTLQSQIPTYMNGVLNINMGSNAIYSIFPYITRWIMAYVYMFLGLTAVKKGWLTLTAMRKTSSTLAMWIPAGLLIGIGFLDSESTRLAIMLLVISVGAEAGSTTGVILSTIDLAPNHASVVMGISNSIVSIITVVTPLFVDAVVKDVHERSEWLTVFGIAALIGISGNLVFLVFGSSEQAAWDAPDFLLKHNIKETVIPAEHNGAFEDVFDYDNNKHVIKE